MEGSIIQRVSSMVEWFLMDRNVEVVFRPNPHGRGRIIPEFDAMYQMDGRLITERCLAMCIMSELMRRNYRYTLPQIISCLTEQCWKYYISHQDYPQWLMAEALRPIVKRPRGRPRKLPKPLPEAEPKVADPGVNEVEMAWCANEPAERDEAVNS